VTDKYTKRKIRGSAFTVVLSLTLVLFMLGLLGLLLLNTRNLVNNIKENINLQVFVKESAAEVDIEQLRKELDLTAYVKSADVVTKEQAAEQLKKDLNEDFIAFLGTNPLSNSFNIKLNANYANNDSLAMIEKALLENVIVKEVIYQKVLVNEINSNASKIGLIILVFSVFLLLIALALINNTIRLSIYAQRFVIKTMYLVGATQRFIRWPFIWRGITHGVVSGLIAILMMTTFIYFMQNQISEYNLLQDKYQLLILFGFIILLGILIAGISSSLSVRKYLRSQSDDLYLQ
jgi:cell division transport system permease protein